MISRLSSAKLVAALNSRDATQAKEQQRFRSTHLFLLCAPHPKRDSRRPARGYPLGTPHLFSSGIKVSHFMVNLCNDTPSESPKRPQQRPRGSRASVRLATDTRSCFLMVSIIQYSQNQLWKFHDIEISGALPLPVGSSAMNEGATGANPRLLPFVQKQGW